MLMSKIGRFSEFSMVKRGIFFENKTTINVVFTTVTFHRLAIVGVVTASAYTGAFITLRN